MRMKFKCFLCMVEEFSGICFFIRRSKIIFSYVFEIVEIIIDVYYYLNSNFFFCEYFIFIRLVLGGCWCRNII